VLAPHTDDGELGAGASISRWQREGNEVHYVAFSACETTQTVEPRDVLREECSRATTTLGIDQRRLEILDFEVRHFLRDRQRVLDAMVTLAERIKPDIVLAPSVDDTHQDHVVVADEARRAFKRTRMLGYEVPWNNFRFETTAFVGVAGHDLRTKQAALQEFRSQDHRPYMSAAYVEAQLRFRGVQAGLEFAEAFQVLRWYL
jgi:LmbE family N-acetylglucosaminyl deacetylase